MRSCSDMSRHREAKRFPGHALFKRINKPLAVSEE